MTPLSAYAPRGEWAIGRVPRNYGANLTLIASLLLSGMGEALLLDGLADAAVFEALPSISTQDALGWFLHCGYPVPSADHTAQSLSTPL